MRRRNPVVFLVALALAATFVLPAAAQSRRGGAATAPRDTSRTLPALGDRDMLLDAARSAWRYVDRQYQPESGFVNSVINYHYATVWDIGSGIAALYCARRLDLVADDEYDRRMRRTLRTLRETKMFDGVAFNKNYATRTGGIAGRNQQERDPEQRGYGWSATDLGRLLMILKIVERNEPRYAEEVRAVVARLDFSRLVADGYLRGEDLSPAGRQRRYQEGKLGYEQYAATGFAVWGHPVEKALSLTENTFPVTVMGIPLLGDRRGSYNLTSEPLVMLGLEAGWTPEQRELAWRVLAAQEERWRRTGTVTMVSEDALNRPPYFLYYSVHSNGKEFPVEAPDGAPPGDTPRTVSVKAAFGWHALLPSAYTLLGIERVAPARTERGWGAGVFEADGRVSGGENVNTAAVVLEAALYARTGRPLIEGPHPAR